MKRAVPPPWSDLLAYLREIGYGDLYLKPEPAAQSLRAEQTQPATNEAGNAALPSPAAASAGLDPAEVLSQLESTAAEARQCTSCALSQGRRNVVFSSGNPQAELMLIGEAPGEQEDLRGEPFVGPAGDLLTKILAAIDLGRDQVYIANMVKCRPPGNRNPEPGEIHACSGFLARQVALVRPRLIVLLGRVAAQAMLRSEDSLGRLRGRWHEVHGVPARVTYHPAALLRVASYKRPTWEDFQLIRDRLRAVAPG